MSDDDEERKTIKMRNEKDEGEEERMRNKKDEEGDEERMRNEEIMKRKERVDDQKQGVPSIKVNQIVTK